MRLLLHNKDTQLEDKIIELIEKTYNIIYSVCLRFDVARFTDI